MSQAATAVNSNNRTLEKAKANVKTKTRSRNGCPQCKSKRLKCDETKPECLMCLRNGRKCPGYNQSFRWSTKHEKSLSDRARGPTNLKALVTETSRTLAQEPVATTKTSASELGGGNGGGGGGGEAVPRPRPQGAEPDDAISPTSSSLGVADQPGQGARGVSVSFLSPGEHGPLTPTADNGVALPVFDYGIEDLLQDIWDEDVGAVCGSSPIDIMNNERLFPAQPLTPTQPSSSSPPPPPPPPPSSTTATTADAFSFSFWNGGLGLGLGNGPPVLPAGGFPQIPRIINDRSSLLVEEWFRHVCSMWSSFDSEVNLNRKLASETWTRSEAVMNCLQSMSATCLTPQMPQMRQVAVSYLRGAIKAIQRDLQSQGQVPGQLPTDLLFALCCVGTAACWIDTKELGSQFLREAKALLKRVNKESSALSARDRHTLNFFNDSLVYWNMLVAVVSDENDDAAGAAPPRLPPAPPRPPPHALSGPVMPHPWTGVSATAQRLFAQAIRVCRRFRRHLRRESISTMRSLQTALGDISEAQRVEEELLGLEQYSIEEVSETGDRMTAPSHFVDVAEGYRLASLLQLYQTFPDLVARRLPGDSGAGGHVPWERWIVPLSLRLVNTLKRIPPSSGTRCIQPLLYLSASTGLRFDTETLLPPGAAAPPPPPPPGPGPGPGPELPGDAARDRPHPVVLHEGSLPPTEADLHHHHRRRPLSFGLDVDTATSPAAEVHLTRLSIEVSYARRFVMERLSSLEHSLPPAPVLVAKDLVKAVWASYDRERPGASYTHWIDVMEDSDLRTIFG